MAGTSIRLLALMNFTIFKSVINFGNRYLIDIEQLDGFDNKNYNVEKFLKRIR